MKFPIQYISLINPLSLLTARCPYRLFSFPHLPRCPPNRISLIAQKVPHHPVLKHSLSQFNIPVSNNVLFLQFPSYSLHTLSSFSAHDPSQLSTVRMILLLVCGFHHLKYYHGRLCQIKSNE